jgi:hypothetical protein
LTAQGKDAPGGAKRYVVDGRMTGGYALVVWPAKWGDTGVIFAIALCAVATVAYSQQPVARRTIAK